MAIYKTLKTVYFIRHGKSTQNNRNIFQGHDSVLDDTGKIQAESIAQRASKLSFEALISSPTLRAKETAEVIGRAVGKTPEFSDLFVESIIPASIDGKSYTDEEASLTFKNWQKSLHGKGGRVENGETFEEIMARADKALEFLKERDEKAFVVVTHGYFLRTIVAKVLFGEYLSGEAYAKFQKSANSQNTGITVLRYGININGDVDWRLWIYNDHAHLG